MIVQALALWDWGLGVRVLGLGVRGGRTAKFGKVC